MARPPPPRRNPPPPRPTGLTKPEGPPPPRASVPHAAELEPDKPLPQTFFLGRYRVVDEIGVGGMASVHLARVDGPGGFQKWVAIKRIHPHLVEDDQFVDMFLDEARIAAGINHANVAQVFDLGKDDNTYWIAMEYLHGEPLREVMRRVEQKQVRIPFHIAARVCADAAEGLHGAHELRGRNGQLLNLVHRDVTPHNLFVTYDGYTKVVDFGIAKVVDRLASTRAGTLKGKLAYMSPEQVRGQEVDRRTDIFALGVVLWELTTNRRLFRMDTDLDTLEKVQACVVPLPSSIIADYPKELENVVMKALSQRREDRYQTAREFSRALQRFLMTQGTFVGPEDVGDFCEKLFVDRVKKRERYLEWAAEVTSTVDVDQLRAQQTETPSVGIPRTEIPSQSHVQPRSQVPPPPNRGGPPSRPAPHRSMGQNSAAAAVVTSAPAHPQVMAPQVELASSSLMDEDEDIPTVVAQRDDPRYQPQSAKPLPAAGLQQPAWDGTSTQLVNPDTDDEELNSTIALPDGRQAEEIRQKIEQMESQRGIGGQQPAQANKSSSLTPTSPGQIAARQAAIETKMSMPRPAAVAQWLVDQGDVQIHGPRSTAVLIAIALLSTLCVIGVGALVAYKVKTPARTLDELVQAPSASAAPDAAAPTSPDTGSGATTTATDKPTSGDDADEPQDGDDSAGNGKTGAGTAPAKDPGTLSVWCKPACDQVIVGGQALGPSPISKHSMPPGQHRVTLKRGGVKKTISVVIESGQLTSQNVPMQ